MNKLWDETDEAPESHDSDGDQTPEPDNTPDEPEVINEAD